MVAKKTCRHTNSLNERKIQSTPILTRPPTDTEYYLCLTCFKGHVAKGVWLQHGRDKSHPLAWMTHANALYCAPCGSAVDTEELSAKLAANVDACLKVLKDRLDTMALMPKPLVTKECKDSDEKKSPKTKANPAMTNSVCDTKKRPPGLYNLGNTCFMNSALQSLLAVSLNHPPRESDYPSEGKGDLSAALFDLLETMRTGSSSSSGSASSKKKSISTRNGGTAINPNHFFECLSEKYDFFERNEQQDSHDFLRLLFNALDDEQKNQKHAWHKRVFGGVSSVRVRCNRCGNVTTTDEHCLDLSLSLSAMDDNEDVNGNVDKVTNDSDDEAIEDLLEGLSINHKHKSGEVNVNRLIRAWNKTQVLTGDNAFACENCFTKHRDTAPVKQRDDDSNLEGKVDEDRKVIYTAATCQSFIKQPPTVLMIHLQRFSIQVLVRGSRRRGYFGYSKDHTPISPSPLINLNSVMLPPHHDADDNNHDINSEDVVYKLRAIIIHEGHSANSGHYIAMTRWGDSTIKEQSAAIDEGDNEEDNDHDHDHEDKEEKLLKSSESLETSESPKTSESWYRISDSSVAPISAGTALSHPGPYILFYERL